MDICAAAWNEDDAANSAAAPDGAPEGMAPGGVNDVLRAHQGALKRWYLWTVPRATAGSAAAYTLAYGVSPGALVDGMTHVVRFHAANAAGATLAVNGLGARPLRYWAAGAWRPLPPGLLAAQWIGPVAYDAASGGWRLVGLDNRTGTLEDWAGPTAPPGTVLCHGQELSRADYAGLFAATGEGAVWGAGDGTTTFNAPDLRGRVAAGRSDMGGTDAGILAGGTVLGAGLGAQNASTNISITGTAVGTLLGQSSAPVSGQGTAVGGGAAQLTDWNHRHDVSVSGSLDVSGAGATTITTVQPSRIVSKIIRL